MSLKTGRLLAPMRNAGKWLLLAPIMLFPAETVQSGRSTSDFSYPGDALVIRRPETERTGAGHHGWFRPTVPRFERASKRHPEINLPERMEFSLLCPVYLSILESWYTTRRMERNSSIPVWDEPVSCFSRCPDRRLSMREEMIEIEDLDNGRYGAAIVRNTVNKSDIRGFLDIPTVWGQQLTPPDALKRSVSQLAESLNRYTGVSARMSAHLYLDSRKLAGTPFLFITTDQAFELTPQERENLGQYLRNGGFVFADNGTPQYDKSAAEASLRQMFRDALGCYARFEPLPVSHPLYHCCFDFREGPPNGSEIAFQQTDTVRMCGSQANTFTFHQPSFYLEGIFLDNRLVGVFSNKGYSGKWKDLVNNIPQLKFGVNLVVYALTREGGLTERNMEHFKDVQ
ncbi:MAG: DUF4159 domain-containing protein [Candidatus Latescibacterota bacterium]